MGAPPWLSAAPAAAGPEGMSGNLISRDKLQSFLLADLGCQCVNLFCLICAIVVKAENGAYDCGFWKSGTCDKDRVDNGPSMVFVGYYVWFYPLLISLIFRSVMSLRILQRQLRNHPAFHRSVLHTLCGPPAPHLARDRHLGTMDPQVWQHRDRAQR